MIRRLCCCLVLLVIVSGCTYLPGEDRSFAVVLAIDCNGDGWQVAARIPTYQQDGGYQTIYAEADSLAGAMAGLNQCAPMQLHFGQIRVIILGSELAANGMLQDALTTIAQIRGMRMDAVLAVTQSSMTEACSAMIPATGSRLSKSLDEQLKTRWHQGVIPLTTLADVQRFADRQTITAARLRLPSVIDVDEAAFQFSGCCVFDSEMKAAGYLSEADTQLLLLLLGQWKRGTLMLGRDALRVSNTSVRIKLNAPDINVQTQLHVTDTAASDADTERAFFAALHALCRKLSNARCDALGVGRQAIQYFDTQGEWLAADWPAIYQRLQWQIQVELQGPARVK